jgi:dipeptide transport system ATP-binding protein
MINTCLLKRLAPQGELPSPLSPPKACVFSTRCPYVKDCWRTEHSPLCRFDDRPVACHYAEQFLETQPS